MPRFFSLLVYTLCESKVEMYMVYGRPDESSILIFFRKKKCFSDALWELEKAYAKVKMIVTKCTV